MIFLAVCLVVGGLAAWRLKTPTVGDYLKLSVDARDAKPRADKFFASTASIRILTARQRFSRNHRPRDQRIPAAARRHRPAEPNLR